MSAAAPLLVLVSVKSPTYRPMLRVMLEEQGDIRSTMDSRGGEGVVARVVSVRPDLVIVDLCDAPGDGLTAVQEIMARHPVPILVFTNPERPDDRGLAAEAMRHGALASMARPARGDRAAELALRARVRRLARVSVVRPREPVPDTAPSLRRTLERLSLRAHPRRMVGIAGSAGGSAAIAAILGALGPEFPACIAVVQHLAPGFARPFADFLREQCRLRVVLVEGRAPAAPGTVLVPADDRHLEAVGDDLFAATSGAPLHGYRPSATVLFRSLARAWGDASVGVVLSGMGDDGAAGLLEMRAGGALTIAQDAETSTVFGMPRAAIECGAATEVVGLDAVAPALWRATVRGEAAS